MSLRLESNCQTVEKLEGYRRDNEQIDRRVQLAADFVCQMGDGAYIGDRLLDGRWALAVVELFPVQVNLEASLTNGCQCDRDFTISASDDLCCQAYSLVPVASSDAVDDLELGFAFHCAVSPSIRDLERRP